MQRANFTRTLCASFLILALGASSAGAQSERAHADGERAKAAELFKSQCSSCHFAPDPAMATDRAWLNQIKDTA